jgi:hypothetical protein
MPTLTTMADMAADGCLVKPLFYAFIMDTGHEVSLNLLVDRPLPRQPDGWFHASQHPTATDKELFQWIKGRQLPESMDYISLMSVMFGSLAHAVIEAFLDWAGAAVPLPPGDCPACGRPRRPLRARPSNKYCTEHGAVDKATMARCHLDSILDFNDGNGQIGFDFKTIYPMGFKGSKNREAIRDMDAEQFRERWPHYWAQMQECMRITGLRKYIVFFLTMGNPWDTREFHFDFDPEFAVATEKKYKRVLSCIERGLTIVA